MVSLIVNKPECVRLSRAVACLGLALLTACEPAPSATPAVVVTASGTPAPKALPTRTAKEILPPGTSSTIEADGAGPVGYVPVGYAGTALGQAVSTYNATHPYRVVLHVVSGDSEGIDGEMYQDLLAREWYIMGPEDFAGSIEKQGWPYVVIAREETLDANPVKVWGYVLDHEFVHMVAAANLATEGLNLAELMRAPDGIFTHEARFHEVCADYYPRDEDGNHRPVARSYGAMDRMPQLLEVLDDGAPAHDPPPGYEVLDITGVPLVDAACVWDREAMEAVRDLYDAERGLGAFDVLFPTYR